MPELKDQYIELPDGRRLGYAEYGTPNGTPVLFFHGSPGSRYIHADMADLAARCKVRLIAFDRPGYGLSDAKSGRTMLDCADDITVLADKLGLEQFALLGFSGGTPFALACAYKLTHRIRKVVLVGALTPLDAPGVTNGMSPAAIGLYALARSNPIELRNTFAALAPTPAALVATVAASVSNWDKTAVLSRQAELETEYTETLRTGIEGVASDYDLLPNSWRFPLDDIQTETRLWCGTADSNTPPAMTNHLSSVLRNSRAFMLEGEGHFVLYGHWEEILAQTL